MSDMSDNKQNNWRALRSLALELFHLRMEDGQFYLELPHGAGLFGHAKRRLIQVRASGVQLNRHLVTAKPLIHQLTLERADARCGRGVLGLEELSL